MEHGPWRGRTQTERWGYVYMHLCIRLMAHVYEHMHVTRGVMHDV